jgi:hypothetical protein
MNLAWAAAGKDPGFGPGAILEGAARSSRYSTDEVAQLAFAGEPPDVRALAQTWHRMLDSAGQTIALLPPDQVGTCVLDQDDGLLRVEPADLVTAIAERRLRFRRGSIRGTLPRLLDPSEGG